jgi:hypothetical protein
MFFISPNQVLVEHILVDILWDYGWKLCEKNDTWWKEWAKLPMVDHLNKKKKKSWCDPSNAKGSIGSSNWSSDKA